MLATVSRFSIPALLTRISRPPKLADFLEHALDVDFASDVGLRNDGSASFSRNLGEEVPLDVAHRVLDAHFDNEKEFALPLPIPSVARSDPSFYPSPSPFIWRGPTWSFINWFLYHASEKAQIRSQGEPAP